MVLLEVSGSGYSSLFGIGMGLDRKARPTIEVARREDVSTIEIEAVRIELRLVGADSPVDAIVARVPQRASSHNHVPATS